MNLNQLLTFFHAAQEMNFSRAAAKLNVTQPAVSTQIRFLERELDVRLFARLGKRLALTEAGDVLLGYARKIFALQQKADEVMRQMRLVRKGTLKLGAARTYARHILPPLLAGFQSNFPLVQVVMIEGSSQEMTQKLRSLEV
ncbi:MAG: LysR family transcriptional regulator, partial [Desulfarculaceae bacterium]